MKNTFLFQSGIWLIMLASFFSKVRSQNAEYTAEFPEITKSGFYHVALSPTLVSKTGNQFNRLRIYEGKEEIPYLIKKYALSTTTVQLHHLPILEKIRKDSLESIVFGNPDSVKLTQVQLTMKRAWTAKKIKISGSPDRKTWYTVRAEFMMNLTENNTSNNKTDISYSLDLPLTDYKFYKIECNNKDDLAVNVLSIGYLSGNKTTGSLIELPQATVSVLKTNEKASDLFRITFPQPYIVNKLVFDISQPHLFHRNVRLYTENPLKQKVRKNKRKDIPTVPFSSFILSSKDSVSAIEVDNIYTDSLFVLVENQNNPSLEINSVRGYYHPYYIKTYLEKGKKYVLNIGNDNLLSPVYDLSNFDNLTNEEVQTLTLKTLIESAVTATDAPETFFKSKIWLSVGLLFVAVILGYACIQMVQDMKK